MAPGDDAHLSAIKRQSAVLQPLVEHILQQFPQAAQSPNVPVWREDI
jgi:hypothetical protein